MAMIYLFIRATFSSSVLTTQFSSTYAHHSSLHQTLSVGFLQIHSKSHLLPYLPISTRAHLRPTSPFYLFLFNGLFLIPKSSSTSFRFKLFTSAHCSPVRSPFQKPFTHYHYLRVKKSFY